MAFRVAVRRVTGDEIEASEGNEAWMAMRARGEECDLDNNEKETRSEILGLGVFVSRWVTLYDYWDRGNFWMLRGLDAFWPFGIVLHIAILMRMVILWLYDNSYVIIHPFVKFLSIFSSPSPFLVNTIFWITSFFDKWDDRFRDFTNDCGWLSIIISQQVVILVICVPLVS